VGAFSRDAGLLTDVTARISHERVVIRLIAERRAFLFLLRAQEIDSVYVTVTKE
jgi:hypothetical protein